MLEDHLRFNLAAVIALADQTITGPAHNSGPGTTRPGRRCCCVGTGRRRHRTPLPAAA